MSTEADDSSPAQEPTPIVFAPNLELKHDTSEFRCTVKTNAWGFRGNEIAEKRDDVFRIVVIGDSFTYGWGVDLEDTWPSVVESLLKDAGLSLEILNLGKPGATTDHFASIAKLAIPLLKPDLVIVGVLQGNDLFLLDKLANDRPVQIGTNFFGFVSKAIKALRETLAEPDRDHTVNKEWLKKVQDVVQKFTPAQQEKFENLAEPVKQIFLSGNLNPSLIQTSMVKPNYLTFTLTPSAEDTRTAIEAMKRHLGQIKGHAQEHNARYLVFSVPHGAYVNAHAREAISRLGFDSDKSFLETSVMDDILEDVCEDLEIEFAKITQELRKFNEEENLFYEFDTHPTPGGHRRIAEAFTKVLQSRVLMASSESELPEATGNDLPAPGDC